MLSWLMQPRVGETGQSGRGCKSLPAQPPPAVARRAREASPHAFFPMSTVPKPSRPRSTPAHRRGGEVGVYDLLAPDAERQHRRPRQGRGGAAGSRRAGGAGPCALRGHPGWARRRLLGRWLARSAASSGAFSSRRTCCRRMSSASRCGTKRRRPSKFKPGPIFANVVLADGSTAPRRTQSSLLEAMSEGRVSVDHYTYTSSSRSW